MKKTHHPGYWTLSILGADLFHTHTHTYYLWYVVLSIWGMFPSTRKSSSGCHVNLWSITQATSWSLTPSYRSSSLTWHHTVSVCLLATEYMFVSLSDRKAAVFRSTSVVLLATNRMMMEMKLICPDNKKKASSRPFTHREYHQRGHMGMSVTKDDSYTENHYTHVQSSFNCGCKSYILFYFINWKIPLTSFTLSVTSKHSIHPSTWIKNKDFCIYKRKNERKKEGKPWI